MITIYKGDFKRISLKFSNDDGSVLDLTGSTVYFTAKRKFSDCDNEAVITIDVSVHDDPTNGLTHIDITSTNSNIQPSQYICGIQLKDFAGKVTTFDVEGLTILPSPRIVS